MKILVTNIPEFKYDWPDDVEAVSFDESQPIPPEHRDAEACVLWGGKNDVQGLIEQLPRVRWYQSYAAGPDRLLNAQVPDNVVITNGRNFHDRTVAEAAIGMTLFLSRRFGECVENAKRGYWDQQMGAANVLQDGQDVWTMVDANVLVWGFGEIGQQVGRVFATVGANVTGVARSVGERAGFPVVDVAGMRERLGDTDVLVMVLPSTEDTRNILDEQVLRALPPRALVVNVGRGTTVDEDALITALQEGWIAGAAIDVAHTEPLPQDSPLWQAPNLLITPHSAGCRPDGVEQRILHNLEAFRSGRIDQMIGVVRAPKIQQD